MCHFPTAWVTYPASARSCAIVTSPWRPPASPYIGGRSRPWRIGSRPVISDARAGGADGLGDDRVMGHARHRRWGPRGASRMGAVLLHEVLDEAATRAPDEVALVTDAG